MYGIHQLTQQTGCRKKTQNRPRIREARGCLPVMASSKQSNTIPPITCFSGLLVHQFTCCMVCEKMKSLIKTVNLSTAISAATHRCVTNHWEIFGCSSSQFRLQVPHLIKRHSHLCLQHTEDRERSTILFRHSKNSGLGRESPASLPTSTGV